jgi:hypothetical protein
MSAPQTSIQVVEEGNIDFDIEYNKSANGTILQYLKAQRDFEYHKFSQGVAREKMEELEKDEKVKKFKKFIQGAKSGTKGTIDKDLFEETLKSSLGTILYEKGKDPKNAKEHQKVLRRRKGIANGVHAYMVKNSLSYVNLNDQKQAISSYLNNLVKANTNRPAARKRQKTENEEMESDSD